MNPRLALSMSAVALLGVFWHLTPSPAGSSGEKQATSDSGQTKSTVKNEDNEPPHLGPWVATCRFFGKDPGADAAKTFCDQHKFGVTLMVATIPDPSKTRLGLWADNSIASIQKGAQDAGWDFDSQWLPWKFATGESGEKLWLPKDAKEAEPGILIFRKAATEGSKEFARHVLFVFIVGETPTSGIDATALAKFFDYREKVFQASTPFDLAGPTFSGSLPSLAYALKAHWLDVNRVYSGTVTYGAYAEVFQRDAPVVKFQSATQNSDTTFQQLVQVGSRLGLERSEIAILAEDETAFGGSMEVGRERFVTIPFPREISSLRNATQVTGTATSSAAQPTSGGVPFSLHDADGGEDSVPLFGHSQTALSQYSNVTRIVSLIRGNFKLVEVAATNVLDSLFLATVLHDGAPDTRILVRNTDLLFVRAAREQSLSGILALSNYPPYLANPSHPDAKEQMLVFPDGDSEGLYQAVYHLLEPGDSGLQPSATWLAEFTATGPWPIARFGPPLKKDEVSSRLPRQWWIATAISSALGCWLCGIIWIARGSKKTRFEIFKTPLPARSPQRFTHGALTVFAIACSLAVLAVFAIPAIALRATATGSELRLLAARYVEIASGCSPAVPLVATILGLLLAALMHMNRFSMVCYRYPGIPGRGLEAEAQNNLNYFVGCTEAVLEHPGMRVASRKQMAVAVAVVVALGFLSRPWSHLSSVEGAAFTWTFFGLALSLLFFIVWSTAGAFAVWKNLRGALGELNRLPLGGAFRRLPHQFSGSAIWAGMPMSRTFVTLFGSAECISELHAACVGLSKPDPIAAGAYAWHLRLSETVQQLRGWERNGKLKDHAELITQFRECAEFLQAEYLVRKWKEGKTDPDAGAGPKAADKPEPLNAEDKVYRLAAKFVALRYAGWLRYVLRHMRNLLFVISGGYALLSVALLSLDFQSPQAIRWFLTILFLAIVTPLLYCMMQMDRDAVLSRMSDTTVGELNSDFYIKAASYIGLPLVGVLSSQFPAFSRFIFSWMQPTLDVLK